MDFARQAIISPAQADQTRPRQRTLNGHDAPTKENNATLTCRIGPCARSKKEAFSDHFVGAIIGLSRGHDTL
ncbi:hypothetical protein BN1723_013565 [Verticillium longisporum]|uniref:Uncharacterized protein n=1 Tax=Verticillium longisporum TaxID=100787 RepID=A0A0G4LTG9_VERLO|nr:hypothetical protein BN1723_013565 [Verticillium longisporum]